MAGGEADDFRIVAFRYMQHETGRGDDADMALEVADADERNIESERLGDFAPITGERLSGDNRGDLRSFFGRDIALRIIRQREAEALPINETHESPAVEPDPIATAREPRQSDVVVTPHGHFSAHCNLTHPCAIIDAHKKRSPMRNILILLYISASISACSSARDYASISDTIRGNYSRLAACAYRTLNADNAFEATYVELPALNTAEIKFIQGAILVYEARFIGVGADETRIEVRSISLFRGPGDHLAKLKAASETCGKR